MVRRVDYKSRRNAVLTAAINKYIEKAHPIASEEMAEAFDLSSATIRNIFAELEQGGYLTHPHTSGGRMPTEKGYRYYVDFLISQMVLLDEEKERIVKEYKKELNRLDDALEETSDIISRITHYASIVSFLEWQDKFFYKGISHILEHPEFRDFKKLRLIINMIEEKKSILNIINRDFSGRIKVYIGSELGCPDIENCALVVSSYGRKERLSGRLAVLGPARMEYGHIIPALEYISDVLSKVLENI